MDGRWKVSEVAEMAGVTVRTLHHYDRIGLLVPADRSDADYRLYAQADLERLHQILVYRELGFGLDEIGGLLDQPALDRTSALETQRELLLERRDRTDAMIRAVDRMLDAIERGTRVETEEMFEGFDELPQAPDDVRESHRTHAREARERWGDSDAFRTSARRVKDYTKADWKELRAEADAQEARMASLLAASADPEGPDAMEGAEAMRLHIDRWFYPCSHAQHAALADMYEQDPRFRAHYEERAGGLAEFVATAIRANALRAWDEDEETSGAEEGSSDGGGGR